jgi:hypothetical protein
MKHLLSLVSFIVFVTTLVAQSIDTLAFQDFEIAPQAPVWTFTGPVIYNSGVTGPNAAPPNSPIGIGGSRAWETTTNSGGLVLDFANTVIPVGYDSLRVRFNLAAMNLVGTTGGPDNLDYVLVAYSTDGGTTFNNRIRVRGAVNNNSFWAYSATAIANAYYQPSTEALFQPTTTGLQTTFGYSTVEIVFPGSVSQIALRITGRSSSSSDTWLIDNLVLTGENNCVNSTSTLNMISCGNYTAPSGNLLTASGTYLDTIPNFAGCDSLITINLTINQPSTAAITVNTCSNYNAPSGTIYTVSGVYSDTIANTSGCDSVITINLTINQHSTSSITANSCNTYTAPSGITYSASGTYNDTITNSSGCDSIITITLSIDTLNLNTTLSGATISAVQSGATYQWIDCNNNNSQIAGEVNQSFSPTVNGNFAVIITNGSCSDTSTCVNVLSTQMEQLTTTNVTIRNNAEYELLTFSGLPRSAQWTVDLIDVNGKILSRSSVNHTANSVSTCGLSSGIYIVNIHNEAQQFQLKFIKN